MSNAKLADTSAQVFRRILEPAKESPYSLPACANSTECYPYVTALDVQQAMQGQLLGSPDFPAIFKGFKDALSGDASFFASGPPPLNAVLSMPLLCSDYGKYPT